MVRKICLFNETGCPRRGLDASKLAAYFRLNNFQVTNDPFDADFIILVTCAFAKVREDKALALIKQMKKYPGELIVLGCLPGIAPQRVKKVFKGKMLSPNNLEAIDSFFDSISVPFSQVEDSHQPYPENYQSFINSKSRSLKQKIVGKISHSFKIRRWYGFLSSNKDDQKTAMLRVASGCNNRCAYCGIRNAVGKLKSKPLSVCLQEYQSLIDQGYRSFKIIADDVGAYGLDIQSSFGQLIDTLSEIDKSLKVKWHIHEIHPVWGVKYLPSLIKGIKSGKISNIDLCIQSGSARTLKNMNRYPDVKAVLKAIKAFRKASLSLSLLAHFIVGFPSETESDFKESLDFVDQCGFDIVRLFKYSDREGTLASKMKNKVPDRVISSRLARAADFLKKKGIRFQIVTVSSPNPR